MNLLLGADCPGVGFRAAGRTAEQVEIAALEYVDWYNRRRLFEACGDIPLAELETALLPSEPGLTEAS